MDFYLFKVQNSLLRVLLHPTPSGAPSRREPTIDIRYIVQSSALCKPKTLPTVKFFGATFFSKKVAEISYNTRKESEYARIYKITERAAFALS